MEHRTLLNLIPRISVAMLPGVALDADHVLGGRPLHEAVLVCPPVFVLYLLVSGIVAYTSLIEWVQGDE